MEKKTNRTAYGVSIWMDQYPETFGEPVHRSDTGVSENCRICRGGAFLDSRRLAEKYLEALLPVFTKRYGEDNFQLFISTIVGVDPKHPKFKRNSDLVRWRLKTSNFNPQAKPYRS